MTVLSPIYLSSIVGGSSGYRILPEAPGDFALSLVTGAWLGSIADLNGDGWAEIIVGSPGSDDKAPDAGRIYIVLSGAVPATSVTAGDTLNDIIVDGLNAGDHAGAVVGSIADMNGDGKAEILVGAPGMERGTAVDAGAAFVLWGTGVAGGVDLGDPFTAAGSGFVIKGEAAGDAAGFAITSVGDLNGDGRPEVLVGAPGSNAGGADSGAAYIVWGRTAETIVNLTSVTAGTGGFRIKGQAAGDAAGTALASIADLNGDGKAELLIGAPGNDAGGADAGAVYVVFGKTGGTQVDLNTIAAGTGGFRITGMAGEAIGSSITSVGDVNGDGKADILLSGNGTNSAYVVYGKSSTTEVHLSDVAIGVGGYAIVAESSGDLVGLSVAGGRDLNGDGITDMLIGTPHNAEGGADAGAVYVVWGGASGTIDLSLVAQGIGGTKIIGSSGSLAGMNVAMTGDLNGDSRGDIMIGSLGADLGTVVYSDPSWLPDPTVYGTMGSDFIGPGYGGWHMVGDGADTIDALDGNDHVTAAGGGDTVAGGIGDDTIDGGDGADQLSGDSGADSLVGGAGNDTLDGGANADVMAGGAGDDTYYVDSAGDTVSELAGDGTDTVVSSVDATLGDNVENLILTGSATAGTGNDADNTITGTDAGVTLSGLGGADTLVGGTGNDSLDGGTGVDSMAGGAGDDVYVVDESLDVVTEAAGEGVDTVQASATYTLGANVENLTLIGAADISGTGNDDANTITGNSGANTLSGAGGDDSLDGGAGNDSLDGGAGNDTLTGGTGADTMSGGSGDDTYYVDDPGDVVSEDVGGGFDTVYTTSTSFTVGANIEQVVLVGGGAHSITGNADANIITGSTGSDTIDGGAGDDSELGGEGDDVIISSSGHDTLAGGGGDDRYVLKGGRAHIEDFLGHDTIDASEATGNSYIDLSGDTLSHVENEDCDLGIGGNTVLPLDVQFLQDLSGSFGDDIANVQTLVPDIVAALQAVQPNSQFGSSTFVDKPIGPFGAAGEWVYQTLLPLTSNAAALTTAYNGMVIRYGADEPEAQIESLMQLALHSTEVGFRASSARFVILFTDAPFHQAGDGAAAGITTPNNGDAIMNGSPAGTGEDYPLIGQVKTALEQANIIPIFAIANNYESVYQGLVTQLGRGSVVTLTSNSSNVVAAITAGLTAATTTTIEDAVGGAGDDTLLGNDVANALTGNDGNDSLSGGGGSDTLLGGLGKDTLVGGSGADSMAGGADDDIYYVDNSGDVVSEQPGGGTDTVYASVDYALRATSGVEILRANAGTTGLSLTGDETANTLYSGAGDDTLSGGGGNDTYYVDSSGDRVLEAAGGGSDTLYTSAPRFTLQAGSTVEFLRANADATGIAITGNELANAIYGGAGADMLDGGAGKDKLTGGQGDDTYVVDDTGDVVTELSGQGDDTVLASITWKLGTNIENLALTGTAAINATGNALANHLTGNDGANALTGGAGADTMAGGLGNDRYYVDNAGDVVQEASGGGTDTVYTSVDFILTSGAEVEMLRANAGPLGLRLTGNELDNKIYGSDGNDTLDGGLGHDTLSGGAGNDTYIRDATNDFIVEAAGQGTDLVLASVTTTLTVNLENLTLTGALALSGTGNASANVLVGNEAANVLKGGDGNDTLSGGGGADKLYGGIGADRFEFHAETDSAPAAYDIIYDFSSAEGDRVDLSGVYGATLAFKSGAFSGAGHEVRLVTLTSGQMLQVDLDGDKRADMSILIKGGIAAGDIIL